MKEGEVGCQNPRVGTARLGKIGVVGLTGDMDRLTKRTLTEWMAGVGDPRVTLCDVAMSAGVLGGVADGALEPQLAHYAAEHALELAVSFPKPQERQVVSRTPLFASPSLRAETVSEVGFGEAVHVYDAQDGFVRVAAARDGYLGWVPASALGTLPEGAHRFAGLRGHIFAEPEVAAARVAELSYGAPLCVRAEGKGEGGGWSLVASEERGDEGYVYSSVLTSADSLEPTPEALTAFALRFLETPYVWGGVSAWGLDCSGLVQTVYGAFGVALPRDADQQAACGREVAPDAVRAADLLFFPGHVALALEGERFVHANAHYMCVSVDSFSGDAYGQGLRRALTKAVRVL